jgi:hypothetical protein
VSTKLSPASLPVLGQLARVRGRHWVVTDVAPTTLPFDIKSSTVGEGQTLVTLSSVEDDGLGEELRVLWELEAGRRIFDSATLPDLARGRFDDPATLGAFLDALRWGAVTNAETTVLQAPFRAGIAIEDYQLEPVTRALTMPRVNLLVADDVGLGKTIEAGLVIQELLLRQRARRVMVVCPAPLTVKWREEMATLPDTEVAWVRVEREHHPISGSTTHIYVAARTVAALLLRFLLLRHGTLRRRPTPVGTARGRAKPVVSAHIAPRNSSARTPVRGVDRTSQQSAASPQWSWRQLSVTVTANRLSSIFVVQSTQFDSTNAKRSGL